jgi:signal peptidase I
MLNWTLFFVLFLSFGAGLYKLFEKAGHPGWKAAVPGLNLLVWAEITGRKPITLLWLLLPIGNIFTFSYMLIDLVNSFGRWGFWQQFAAVACPWAYFPYLGFSPEKAAPAGPAESNKPATGVRKTAAAAPAKPNAPETPGVSYVGPACLIPREQRPPKGLVREWAESAIFAVFAASFIRMFLIEAYTIPTPSMEGSLLVGDFLFVSKIHYGARTPSRPLSVPLVHNVMPVTGGESYLNWPIWESYRLPSLVELQRNDPFVFNFPEGDSILPGVEFGRQYNDVLNYVREQKPEMYARQREAFLKTGVVYRPVDKRDHYVKRCVGMPGDNIQIIEGQLFVNGQPAQQPDNLQLTYYWTGKPNLTIFLQQYPDVEYSGAPGSGYAGDPNERRFLALTSRELAAFRQFPGVDSVFLRKKDGEKGIRGGHVFPFDSTHYRWNMDNYGPLHIPAQGETVVLSPENIAVYRRIIANYEGNALEERGGKFFINGQETTTYTIRQNYYWAMGDNRHFSADSRWWGFVPEDHVVGKPLFIFFSLKNANLRDGIRWNRLLRSAGSD